MNTYYKNSSSRREKRTSLHSRGSALQGNRPNKVGVNEKLKIEENQEPLFISNRRNVSTAQNQRQENNQEMVFTSNVIHKKQPVTRFNQTAKQGFRRHQQRPQSKQEPRNKGYNHSGILLKTPILQTNRPQTSKGQRPKICYKEKVDDISKRRVSLEGEQLRADKRPYPIATSNSTRRGSNTARIQFKTSIDPEFLSLFAS